MEVIHQCEENVLPDLRIMFIKINGEQSSWVCEQQRFANELDVRDGEAESLGELIWLHTFVIHYCPFCGVDLNAGSI